MLNCKSTTQDIHIMFWLKFWISNSASKVNTYVNIFKVLCVLILFSPKTNAAVTVFNICMF